VKLTAKTTTGPGHTAVCCYFSSLITAHSALFTTSSPFPPISPPSGPAQRLFQEPPAKSKLLAAAAKSSFLGLEAHHTRDDMLLAVYEGIVFSHNHHLQRLLQFRDKPECIRMTGGAAHREVWVRMFADCFQIPVEIPTGTELGALGATIAAAVATGIYPGYGEAVSAMTRIARRFEPDSMKEKVYAAKYVRYKKAVEALDVIWR
jgi:sugar (pentulose or hexulose) kinase